MRDDGALPLICFDGNAVEGSCLILAISKALKGSPFCPRLRGCRRQPIQCHACSKMGHKKADCNTKNDEEEWCQKSCCPCRLPCAPGSDNKPVARSFKEGHSTRRVTSPVAAAAAGSKRRVEGWYVSNPSGVLMNPGESYPIYLILVPNALSLDNDASKFSGRRVNNIRMGHGSLQSTLQNIISSHK